jgi:chromate transporter
MLVISGHYEQIRKMELLRNALDGVLPVVTGLVAAAAWNLGATSLAGGRDFLLLAAGFLILQFTRISPMLVILGAGVIGFLLRFL